MKWFSILSVLVSYSVYAQAPAPRPEISSYYTDATKNKVIPDLQETIMNGCTNFLEKLPAIDPNELSYRVDQIKDTLDDRFSKSFKENPKIREALHKDLDAIGADKKCLAEGNDCLTKLVATSIYYFQNLRPDLEGCKDYVKHEPMTKGYDNQCEIELKYRNQSMRHYGRANGGMDARGVYTDALIQRLNGTTRKIFRDVLHQTVASPTKRKAEIKHNFNLNICDTVASGVVYQYPLRENFYSEPFANVELNKAPEVVVEKKVPAPCVEEKLTLYSEFVPLNFEEGRSEVGIDQIQPVKAKIKAFIDANPTMIITDVSVTSSSSKTPFHVSVGGKKVIDPNSDARNMSLAQERARFASQSLNELKASNSSLASVNFSAAAVLAGPDFTPKDLNNRFVTKQSKDYAKQVKEIYEELKDSMNSEALIKSEKELMDESRFSNLYQVKYKPFQGFRVSISGYKKELMKCTDKPDAKTPAKAGSATKATAQ